MRATKGLVERTEPSEQFLPADGQAHLFFGTGGRTCRKCTGQRKKGEETQVHNAGVKQGVKPG